MRGAPDPPPAPPLKAPRRECLFRRTLRGSAECGEARVQILQYQAYSRREEFRLFRGPIHAPLEALEHHGQYGTEEFNMGPYLFPHYADQREPFGWSMEIIPVWWREKERV